MVEEEVRWEDWWRFLFFRKDSSLVGNNTAYLVASLR